MPEWALVLFLALAGAGCGITPPCDDLDLSCARGADGTWRCPPPGSTVCADGEIRDACTDHGGAYCVVPRY